jgi:hypothetical protein
VPPGEPRIHRSQVVGFLASSLGDEKSATVWDETVRRLGIPANEWLARDQVIAVLDALAAAGQLVGLAARYAKLRLDRFTPRPFAAQSAPPIATRPVSSRPSPMTDELFALLAPSVGEEKAREAIAQTASSLHLPSTDLTRAHALAIMEELAKSPGLLGVAARLGMARFVLHHPR